MDFMAEVVIRALFAVIVGAVIGSERAHHGRAAGMRTHILVCLGSTLTSMIGIYVYQSVASNGDILRLSAQVVSGVGFLGAGMIILKNNNVITGLTTAAGMWTTSVIGIAIGSGFYWGALVVSLLYFIAITLLGKLEKNKKANGSVYLEIDDMYKTNQIIEEIKNKTEKLVDVNILPPKSNCLGNLGIYLTIDTKKTFDINVLLEMEHVVFAEFE